MQLAGRFERVVGIVTIATVVAACGDEDATMLPEAEIDVEPIPGSNTAPVISGVPAGGVTAGTFYDFIPAASDADGDALSFTIQNRPGWAQFDPQIGRLSGTPDPVDVGSYGNIVISVSDGFTTASLAPFVVVVNPPPSQNTPPTISGQPASSVLPGNPYSFTPTASDFDGDALSFSVIALPGWAQFNAATGRLSGTAAVSDAGTYTGLSIAVSDGEATAALPSFSIEVVDPNSPPTISGNPDATVVAGDAYSFVPSANDPDGDTLSFSITDRKYRRLAIDRSDRLCRLLGHGIGQLPELDNAREPWADDLCRRQPAFGCDVFLCHEGLQQRRPRIELFERSQQNDSVINWGQ
jgi:hypothetical protein